MNEPDNLTVSAEEVGCVSFPPPPETRAWAVMGVIKFELTFKPTRWQKFWYKSLLGWEIVYESK